MILMDHHYTSLRMTSKSVYTKNGTFNMSSKFLYLERKSDVAFVMHANFKLRSSFVFLWHDCNNLATFVVLQEILSSKIFYAKIVHEYISISMIYL